MLDYHYWARDRVLEAAEALSGDQFRRDLRSSFTSVRDTLAHTLNAQWLYLERWQGRSPRTWPDAAASVDLASIRARWDVIERDTQAFLAALTEARAAAVVEYTNMQGERWAYPLWQQLLHQVNHATQHRSEAAMLLTNLGHSPGWLDLLYFYDVGGPDMAPDTP